MILATEKTFVRVGDKRMDRITKSLLEDFCREHELDNLPEDKQFEHFAAYLCMSRYLAESFDTSEIVVGAGGDTAIDAIGIVINGALVTERDAVKNMAEWNKYLEVEFIFIQAERSSGFATDKIGQIGYGVQDFFREAPQLVRNELVTEATEISQEIYNRSGLFKKGKPSCHIYYITTGKWTKDQNFEARRKSVIEYLSGENIFNAVEFAPVDADLIHKWDQETKNAISRDFIFERRTAMPEIPGVDEAYLGILPGSEFLRLVQDENGAIIRSIFYDNVRDWQDYSNPVNRGIRQTMEDNTLRTRFALMNNGITIIAKSLRATGNRIHIDDYQIVNGCQTSHVLYDQRNVVDEQVMVPIRLIATQDEDVIASIIMATNRQTSVKEEQLLALSAFQKKLERFFQTFENGKKLYFERRSRQYNVPGIEKTRIVTRDKLMLAYASVFLERV